MKLEKARSGWQRAERMLRDLGLYISDSSEDSFLDRVPYVFDLLAGVRRLINDEISSAHHPAVREWWAAQKTEHRDAITQMRHAQLKRLEQRTSRRTYSQTLTSQGTINGRPANAGDTFIWHVWTFADGYFEGQDVIMVAWEELLDLKKLLDEAEARLA